MNSSAYIYCILAIVFMLTTSKALAKSCVPAELNYCSFPISGFKVGRINDLSLGGGAENVDTTANKLQIDAASFTYNEVRIHSETQCNVDENELIGRDVEIAFTLDSDDGKQRTITEIWILPCTAVQLR